MKRATGSKAAAGIIAAVVLAGVGASGTAGYLAGEDRVENVFSVGDLQIDLREPEWQPQEGDGESMCPGNSVYKNPTVKNTASEGNGGNPCYMRMKVQILKKDGSPVTSEEALNLIQTTIRYDDTYTGNFSQTGEGTAIEQGRTPGYSLEEIEGLPMVSPLFQKDEERSVGNILVFNYEGKDGTGVLSIGEEATLFTAIVFPAEWTEKEMEQAGDFTLNIQAEAIQITGFESRGEAYGALDAEQKKGGSYAG